MIQLFQQRLRQQCIEECSRFSFRHCWSCAGARLSAVEGAAIANLLGFAARKAIFIHDLQSDCELSFTSSYVLSYHLLTLWHMRHARTQTPDSFREPIHNSLEPPVDFKNPRPQKKAKVNEDTDKVSEKQSNGSPLELDLLARRGLGKLQRLFHDQTILLKKSEKALDRNSQAQQKIEEARPKSEEARQEIEEARQEIEDARQDIKEARETATLVRLYSSGNV